VTQQRLAPACSHAHRCPLVPALASGAQGGRVVRDGQIGIRPQGNRPTDGNVYAKLGDDLETSEAALPGVRCSRVRGLRRAQAGGLQLSRARLLSLVSGPSHDPDRAQSHRPCAASGRAPAIRADLAVRAARPAGLRRQAVGSRRARLLRLGARLLPPPPPRPRRRVRPQRGGYGRAAHELRLAPESPSTCPLARRGLCPERRWHPCLPAAAEPRHRRRGGLATGDPSAPAPSARAAGGARVPLRAHPARRRPGRA